MNRKLFPVLIMFFIGFISWTNVNTVIKIKKNSWELLRINTSKIGKPEWQPMLLYVAQLHEKSTHPAHWPFNYEWEEIGPGYAYAPAFGHWDIIHSSIDVMKFYPEHALHQLLNNLQNQEPNGLIPGVIWMPGDPSNRDTASWSKADQGHPPVWVVAAQDYMHLTGDKSFLPDFFSALVRQITWFENSRKAETEGFYYNDILLKKWESGVDEGIRFDETSLGKWACIDATCHVFQLYRMAAAWAEELRINADFFRKRENELKKFIQEELYVAEEGMFYDWWAVKDTRLRCLSYENLWPLIVGAISKEQANRLIDNYVLNTSVFLTEHPIATVAANSPKFELRMWRGPAWNSMSYWVARACADYGRNDAAKIILEKALDDSAKQFVRTGTIWEFYHPHGGNPEDVKRKPQTKKNAPCTDYLGHNPMIAMAILYDQVK